ncbi:MAG: hypothetical protein LBC85_00630 [Fibromonadaceae bacterium]|jgi:hypothetical protein|nr:hypothetical protein [Fibromonadaceae bacterium]
MRRSEFETKLIVGIASHRLALLSEIGNRDLYYSSEMYKPDESRKVYLLELSDDYFILRSDLIFDECVERFFYVTKERYEYNAGNLKTALTILRRTENRVYDILSKLGLRGFYSKSVFIRRLLQLVPQLELIGNTVKERNTATVFVTIREDFLRLDYKDGAMESYMNLVKKDLNERILLQCVELITAALKYAGK